MSTNARRAGLAALLILACLAPQAFAQDAGQTYSVTLTNLTRSQIISPPILVTHQPQGRLFHVGRPASDGIAALAEDADAAPLLDELAASDRVFDVVVADGPLLPGASVTLEISADSRFRRLSAVGMLVTTNDAFFALDSLLIFPGNRFQDLSVPAFDAGSEANSEDCDTIPGPPCNNPFVRDTDEAEGFVHVHSGVFGHGDLPQAAYDWRNPVVAIRIQRSSP